MPVLIKNPAAGPLVTGIIVMAAGYVYGFLTSFLLCIAVIIVFRSIGPEHVSIKKEITL